MTDHFKLSYATVLKTNTNLRRKFRKEHLAENEPNSTAKNSVLTARRSGTGQKEQMRHYKMKLKF